ncbi:MAG: hypothetical protein PHP98_01525 [Kiritimatiellae bacterium]|nr:hypothetical protein [Kiritimatiellia bacterium]
MKKIILLAIGIAAGAAAGSAEQAAGKVILDEMFDRPEIGANWVVKEGYWTIKNGSLCNTDGGVILAAKPMEGDFALECEVRVAKWNAQYPWVDIIVGYDDPENYMSLMFTPGERYYYLRATADAANQMSGGNIPFDQDVFHKVRLESRGLMVKFFWDGVYIRQHRFSQILPAMVGFMGNKSGAEYEIRAVRISEIQESGRQVGELTVNEIMRAQAWEDAGNNNVKRGRGCEEKDNAAWLEYDFKETGEYAGVFVRMPARIGNSEKVLMEIAGDGSANKAYLIARDAGDEEHLIGTVSLNWDGWRKISLNYEIFLKPPGREIYATHWGGDGNQTIDFPIKQIEVGVVRSDKAVKRAGRIGVRNIRFMKDEGG